MGAMTQRKMVSIRQAGAFVEPLEGRRLLSGTPVPVGDAPQFRVNETTAGDQATYGDRNVATDAQGNFVVAWRAWNSGTPTSVYARRYNAAGEALGAEFLVAARGDAPSVAMNASGSFVIVYDQATTVRNKTTSEARGRRYDAAGNLLGEFSCGASNGMRPGVDIADDGSFAVAWGVNELKAFKGAIADDVLVQRFTPAGGAAGAAFRANDTAAGLQRLPSVAMDGAGNFLVAWQSNVLDGTEWDVYARRFSAAGAALEGEVRVNSDGVGRQSTPSAAPLPGGGYALAWYHNLLDGAAGDVHLRRYEGGTWSAERTVNSFTANNQSAPSVAADDSGNVTVVWHSNNQDGVTGNAVYGQQYDASGQPAGGEFRINSYSDGAQAWASVAAQPDGKFVAVWSSTIGQDGSGYGVYARLFGPAAPVAESTFGDTIIGDTEQLVSVGDEILA